MHGILTETTLPLTEVASILPRRNGKRINFSTLWRWTRKGCRGVRLETVPVGGVTFTSREALQRFFDALNEQRLHPIESLPIRSLAERERAAIAAGKQLAQMGC